MVANYDKYLPLYVSTILHKYPYAGVSRAVNYQLYLKYLRLCYLNIEKAARPTPTPDEKPKQKEEESKDPSVKI
jgi:hypothetical protein